MRISTEERTKVTDVIREPGAKTAVKGPPDHAALVRAVAQATTKEERVGALLFVGGVHACDVPVQWAQSTLRLDRTASSWSHVAVLLDWPDGAEPSGITGIEVTLDPLKRSAQVPERNGATLFQLARYLDPARYPVLAIGVVGLAPHPAVAGQPAAPAAATAPKDRRRALVEAATDPVRSAQRFPLWDWLGHWECYVRAGGTNPLLDHVPHPGAAFCEYVFEAADVDLTPGATAPSTCPELLWGTLLHWSKSMGASGTDADRVRVWESDTVCDPATRKERPPPLRDEFEHWIAAPPPQDKGPQRHRNK